MPRCNKTWPKKGSADVEVTVAKPPAGAVLVLKVAVVPREPHLPVINVPPFGITQLKNGAKWTVPPRYRCTFTLVTTTNAPVDTKITIDGETPACNKGHCYGKCDPKGKAGVAGAWAITTWE